MLSLIKSKVCLLNLLTYDWLINISFCNTDRNIAISHFQHVNILLLAFNWNKVKRGNTDPFPLYGSQPCVFHKREQHTGAGDSSILVVSAVVLAPAQAFAFGQILFGAVAVDIIQENQASSVAKVGVGVSVDSCTAAYLLAHHLGVVEGPVVVAHRPPVPLVVDLHAALACVLSVH